ncbi:MAG: septation protein IspZ [Alphaproteobacteria bacterium]|nr:septation protein IspZ [Alphaproteobacteria bacterium]MDE2110442.1 septation protein IspZ [Alphaproteobacteria bacterium]MDE2493399.1 septation protein IspZ [Alphaproteobacteria bacterium]
MHLLRALKPLLRDLLSTLVFVGLLWTTGDIYWATGVGIALGIGQTLWYMHRGHAIGPLQWLSLVLVTVLGMTTILTANPHFIMVKPTIIALAIGAMMLRRDWMAPYLPPIVTENLDDREIVRAGYAWAALMFVLAVLNLLFAFLTSQLIWSWYLAVVPPLSYVGLLAVQYLMFRKHVLEKIRVRQTNQTV